jgi:hypothetical protein
MATETFWKTDWEQGRRALADWWNGTGLALHVTAPKDEPWEDILPPEPAPDLETRWLNPTWRAQMQMHQMAHTYYGGVAVPIFNANIGPGSLGLFLGCEGHLSPDTVWYEPNISDPENHPPLKFDTTNRWWQIHLAVLEEGLKQTDGRFLVGCPDLIENIDTLAQLRGPEQTLMDLIERPEWVEAKVQEINQAFFDCFDTLWPLLRDDWGGNAFHAFTLWGPGKTAKVQCDFCCMISPRMFRRFVQPALTEQCAWLDYAMYHLDGTQAIPQLDNLLSIEPLRAIEWTPQAGLPAGGSPEWYDLYRRIKAGGKSVQAIQVEPHEVEPLIEAVGPEGMFICTRCQTETEARRLLERCGWKTDGNG